MQCFQVVGVDMMIVTYHRSAINDDDRLFVAYSAPQICNCQKVEAIPKPMTYKGRGLSPVSLVQATN